MGRNDRNLLILGILIILLVVLGYYFLLFSPLRNEVVQSSEERDAKEEELQQLQQQVSELEAVARNAPEIERQLLELSKRIPEQPEIPTFVVQVEEIAREAGVTQMSIEPGDPEPPPEGGDFSRVPVTMSFEGNFEQLQDFVERLLNLVRLVTINDISFQVAVDEGTTPEMGVERLLEVEVVAEVYFQPDDGSSGDEPVAVPDPPAPGGGGTTVQ
ncbi:MAG: type 4a pilus biogenesis protein PilO [Rubrobacteraceae bacterium]